MIRLADEALCARFLARFSLLLHLCGTRPLVVLLCPGSCSPVGSLRGSHAAVAGLPRRSWKLHRGTQLVVYLDHIPGTHNTPATRTPHHTDPHHTDAHHSSPPQLPTIASHHSSLPHTGPHRRHPPHRHSPQAHSVSSGTPYMICVLVYHLLRSALCMALCSNCVSTRRRRVWQRGAMGRTCRCLVKTRAA